MKKIIFSLLAIVASFALQAQENKLVILHTNDTHSQIDPDDSGLGGIARRKVLVDSVRAAQPNVMLIDAGDAVQGTLFFNLFGGEVEYRMLDLLGYDLAILGNHDFDNGVDALARNLAKPSSVKWLATNYDLSQSALAPYFAPYHRTNYGGRDIAFIALNLDPKGMISEGNYDGVKYIDAVKAANATAWHLKHNEGVDYVIAISHLGFDGQPAPRDLHVAALSEDIDLIIGGHTHTTLPTGAVTNNTDGRPVMICQTGNRGRQLGEITIDLDNLTATSRLIPVNSRLDNAGSNEAIEAVVAPYRHSIDSIMSVKLTRSAVALDQTRLLNLFSDITLERGRQLADNVVMAIINKGGIRRDLPKGDITVGMIMTTLPFNNRITIVDITGGDLIEALNVMASRGGDGLAGNVEITTDGADVMHIESVKIDGKPVERDTIYRIATIDYLANGGDYMQPLTNGTIVARSENIFYDDVINNLSRRGKSKLSPSPTPRMH